MLLHWAVLKPLGPGKLAAVRFTSLVRIKSIRVYPTGSQPFANANVDAITEPEAFFFNVYLNAQPSAAVRDKHKASNTLVTSRLAYAGDQMDFLADMGPEYSTRLLVMQGEFESLSVAIYGDVVSEMAPPPPEYEPEPLPIFDPSPLSRALDPSNASDPTLVAQQLLGLIPDAPPLALAIRLMFSLKPNAEDWEDPRFPYLYAAVDSDMTGLDLGQCYQLTKRPVQDDVSSDTLPDFVDTLASSMEDDTQNGDRLYNAAGILRNCSSQHSDLIRLLTERLKHDDSALLFNQELTYDTLGRLLDAAANVDTARYLDTERLLKVLLTIQADTNAEEDVRAISRRLISRLKGWRTLDDALLNTRADFTTATATVADIGREECSLGIWLQTMTAQPDILRKLAENPVLPMALTHPPPLLGQFNASVTHDEFIAFLRAYIGVACVLAVYAWADSVPNSLCQERALAILRLWQGMIGYREIVNHLILLPQMIDRLEYLLEKDVPSKSRLAAERLLADLAKEPASMLSPDFREAISGLQDPLSSIAEADRLGLNQNACLAADGLDSAMRQLTRGVQHPVGTAVLRNLRVALAFVVQELQAAEGGEWRVMETYWENESQGFLAALVDTFIEVTEGVQDSFSVKPPPCMAQEHVGECFLASNELLGLILRFLPLYPLPTRSLCALTTKVAELFVCTDAADMLYSQTSLACAAAQTTRQTCIEVVRALCSAETGVTEAHAAVQVMRTLLRCGLQSRGDPAFHIVQVFCLIDHILPMSDTMDEDETQVMWAMAVFPRILPDLLAFFSSLDTENKVHLAKRLVHLDRESVGIGEWLLVEELKHLVDTLSLLSNEGARLQGRMVLEYQATASLQFLKELMGGSRSVSAWWISAFVQHDEPVALFSQCLDLLARTRTSSPYVLEISRLLKEADVNLTPALQSAILGALACSIDVSSEDFNLSLGIVAHILKTAPERSLDLGRFKDELRRILIMFVDTASPIAPIREDTAVALLGILQQNEQIYSPLIRSQWDCLCELLEVSLPSNLAPNVKLLPPPTKLDPEYSPLNFSRPRSLAESVDITMGEIDDLFHSSPVPPSTPTMRSADHTPDMLAQVTVSPSALLRSPSAATGLTKTYANNSFRELRATPAARQNTSRLPSMHVDDFQSSQSPEIMPSTGPALPLYQQLSLAPPFSM